MHKAQQQLGANPDASLLSRILTARGGWIRTKDPAETSLLWSMSFTTGALYDHLPPGALVNHFPNTVAVTHKHRLVASLRAVEGGERVAPVGFALPGETEAFLAHERETKAFEMEAFETEAFVAARWILKRAVGGEGKGIAIFRDAAAVVAAARADADASDCPAALPIGASTPSSTPSSTSSSTSSSAWRSATHVVQAYVPRPLLVDGRKLTCARTSSSPRGAASASARRRRTRFARTCTTRDWFGSRPRPTTPRTRACRVTSRITRCRRRGTTRESPRRARTPTRISNGIGHSRRCATRTKAARGAGSFDDAWEGAREAIRTVLRAAAPAVRAGLDAVAARDASRGRPAEAARRHFELLGADILLDENLRAWLLEVNSAPSLVAGTKRGGRVSDTHHHLKAGLIADALNVVDAGGADGRLGADAEEERAARGRFKPLFD